MAQDNRLFMDLNEPFTGACGDCALTCYRLHGSNADGNRNHLRPPCFNKLVADYSVEGGPSCWMKVPEAFVAKYLPHVKRKRMILENREGWRWPVMYSAAHGFQTGWSEFSTANELAVGETLFFSLVEENKFVVHVFNKSGCEKRLTSRTMPTSSTMPSSSTHQRRKAVPDVGQTATYATRTPTPVKSFSRFRPDEPGLDTQRELRFNKNGERKGGTPPGAFYEGLHRSDEDDDAATLQNQQRNRRNSKDGTSSKSRSHSVPPARNQRSWNNLSDIEAGSFLDSQSTPKNKRQEGYLRGKRMPTPTWGRTWSQIRARAAVEKAKLKKMNLTDLHRNVPAYNHRDNQNSLKRKNVSESRRGDRDGFEASSDSDGRAFHGRSYIKKRAFKSTLDSARRGCNENEERAADFRNMNYTSKGKTITEFIPLSNANQAFAYATDTNSKIPSGRHDGGSSNHQQQDSLEIPEFASPRTPVRPQMDSLAGMTPEEMRGSLHDFGGRPKPKRGRPFKYQPTPDSMQSKQVREVFVSRRRPVTQLERDEAFAAAHSFASHINTTTFVLVMRQSFVYRNFVLGLPRRFGHRYMPPCNKEVTLVDAAWKAWFCTWNAAYKYISGRGWRNFALEHCVEEDDVLLFHILSETDTMLIIKVHIFRVVAIPDGLTGWQSHICPANAIPEIHSGAKMQPLPHLESPKLHPRLQSSHVECPIHPRLQSSRHQKSAKKIKREPATEGSAMTESSEELD